MMRYVLYVTGISLYISNQTYMTGVCLSIAILVMLRHGFDGIVHEYVGVVDQPRMKQIRFNIYECGLP